MTKIALKETRNASEGEQLFRLTVKLSRNVEYKQAGEVTVIAKSAQLTDTQWEEVWDSLLIDDLHDDGDHFYEEGHKEEIVSTDTFSVPPVRCRQTFEMDL